MSSDVFDVVLLLALPASGKSELRRYMGHLPEERSRAELHMGPTVQLDDFPYVHFMRRIDDFLAEQGHDRIYFHGPDRSFQDSRDWLTLVELVNDDYDGLVSRRQSANGGARLLFERLEAAALKVGIGVRLSSVDSDVLDRMAETLDPEAKALEADIPHGVDLSGKTVVIEFARGGDHKATPPLPYPFGYEHSLARLDERILSRAVILYVWVTPEESRRKNDARADPNDPGSILHHGVPLEVMLGDYGCDDMASLMERSDRSGTVSIERDGRTFFLPVARFDNRSDKTSFLRGDPAQWAKDAVHAVSTELVNACAHLYEAWEAHRS
ncbi:MAG: hypothetical protein J7M25_15760 [Deltaproteobacteria bacterium]|nr:hypothetical protein [Deltaproteobacteria bacterium]